MCSILEEPAAHEAEPLPGPVVGPSAAPADAVTLTAQPSVTGELASQPAPGGSVRTASATLSTISAAGAGRDLPLPPESAETRPGLQSQLRGTLCHSSWLHLKR